MICTVNKQGDMNANDFFNTKTLTQNFDRKEAQVNFQNANTRNTILDSQCPTASQCFNSKYRNLDGSCNHKNSMFGKGVCSESV